MTSEQITLLNKARQSLQAARLLVDNGFYEFAVSRAYYTMFYLAEMLLLGKGLAFSKHSAVISAFGKNFIKTRIIPKEFHSYLIEGYNSRKIGDYDIRYTIDEMEAIEQIERAEEFYKFAERLMGGDNSS